MGVVTEEAQASSRVAKLVVLRAEGLPGIWNSVDGEVWFGGHAAKGLSSHIVLECRRWEKVMRPLGSGRHGSRIVSIDGMRPVAW